MFHKYFNFICFIFAKRFNFTNWEKKNIENYKAWQEYAFEQAFAIPTFERESITAVNKRVKYYDVYIGSDSKSGHENLELTEEKGIAAE